MRITCPKCQKNILITEEKLPKDKEKAMVKCPGCQQVLVFNVPKTNQSQNPVPPRPVRTEDKTIMHESFEKEKPLDAKLVDEANEKEYALKEGKNVVGRKADISVENDPFISRKNCLIEVLKNSYHFDFVLTDDGSLAETGDPSTNGTFHNGNRLTRYDKVYLSNGDKIRIGHTELIFVCS
jgi:predicted Zn finger-like uncharacterized protein